MFTLGLEAVLVGEVGDGDGGAVVGCVLVGALHFLGFGFGIAGVFQVAFLLGYYAVGGFVANSEKSEKKVLDCG